MMPDAAPPSARHQKTSAKIIGRPDAGRIQHQAVSYSRAILNFCEEAAIEWDYITPGKPIQNAFVESFNG